ncbi:MAG: isoleucine--tRNA ligase [Planctomycetota bacterium]|jgi:isoleucyl-tRNA synthetase|nr:isoleucine--tRNA ligase [Planctomycetota bacterium]
MTFPTLPPEERLEALVQESWDAHEVPARSLARNADGEAFVFFEGPPTANGKPAIHHVFSRTLKDTVCRHRLMKGHRVPRKAGWDTQGLPVEIEVQKELGITTREEIEEIGIAEFNRRCRESVFKYKADWEKLSKRMAYWLDYENPYVTYESDYIQSCWAILSRFHGEGLLVKDFKILPYCPRCSTGLSNHEVALGYETVQDPSVFVRFAVTDHDWAERFDSSLGLVDGCNLDEGTLNACRALKKPSLLVWTTTPWTLFSNVALAVDGDLTYAAARLDEETYILADALVGTVLGDEAEVLARFPGRLLEGLSYQRPLDHVTVECTSDDQRAVMHTVRLASFVSSEDGTGLVHMAPAFGADDFSIRQRDGLPLVLPVDEQGRFTSAVPGFEGRFVKDADGDIIKVLKDRGVLYRRATIDHSYPHCWRCKSPLLYMARPSWYLRTTKLRDKLVALNETIDWHPSEIGTGRFGEWLSNNVDWAISRERYWGTPLNVWVCDACGDEACPASLEELDQLAQQDVSPDFDPHRPQVDEVTLSCTAEGCEGVMRRTPEVIDCWFDSGSMPFAQAGWPRATGGELPADYPAAFICEGLDQTRGWFYTLHVIGTFLTGKPAYKSVLVNNLLLDGQGKKMSKSVGNVVDPSAVFDSCGVDAARWGFVSQGQVWLPKRFDQKAVAEGARRVFGTLRNCYAFLSMYANLDGFVPGEPAPSVSERPPIDRWLLSRVQTLTTTVDAAYERLELGEVALQLDAFIDEQLSNWYVRRNRARFWKSGEVEDKRAAFATLAAALERVALLMAPLVPFWSEWLWRAVTGESDEASVHLQDWPVADLSLVDEELEREMSAVLSAVALGRSVRAGHDLRVRQPLRRALVKATAADDAERLARPELSRLVAEELNVKAVEIVETADFRELSAKPNFKRLGPRLGPKMKLLAAKVKALDEATLLAFEASGELKVEVDGEVYALDHEDVELVETGRAGYAVAGDGRLVLALDTQLDEELLGEGRAREIVNRVQNTRKSAGLEVSDRVIVRLAGSEDLLTAARLHEAFILGEVLGTRLEVAEGGMLEGAVSFDVEGAALQVAVQRVESS